MSTTKPNKRKRSDNDEPSTPLTRRAGRQLDDGTSHTFQADKQAKQMIHEASQAVIRLKRAVHSEMGTLENTYQYIPLREEEHQDIRVLVIEPGEGEERIQCRLVPSALNRPHANLKTKAYPFIALSYFWGEGQAIHDITVTSYKTLKEKVEDLTLQEKGVTAFQKNGIRWKGSIKSPFQPSGTVYVRSNLIVALRKFRSKTKLVKIWIDALCIDQNDPKERSKQVKKMHQVYLQAKEVRVWLGDGTGEEAPNPKRSFQFLRRLLDLKNLEYLLDEHSRGKSKIGDDVENIVSLMCNKWFSRRWVLQELALARKAKVAYGKQTMSWPDFADAIAIFNKSFDKIEPIWKERAAQLATSLGDQTTAEDVRNFGANALVDFTNELFRRSENGEIQQRMMSLENLVSNLLAFEAGDPRDTIYAVLSLAKDTHNFSNNDSGDSDNPHKGSVSLQCDLRVSPSYEDKRLLDVYAGFIDYCIENSKSLDVLFRHWAPKWKPKVLPKKKKSTRMIETEDKNEELPSWIPLIHKSSYGPPTQRIRGRYNGDSFVGVSHRTSHRNYSATLDLEPKYSVGLKAGAKSKRAYDGHLIIKGLHIGTIEQLAARSPEGMIFKETFDIAGFDRDYWEQSSHQKWSPTVQRPPEKFWRTIVADRGPDGRNPPSWYPRACMDSLNHLKARGDLSPKEIIDLPKASGVVKDFLARVKNVVWERKFAEIKLIRSNDICTYGLLPAETEKDDLICVLFGSSVPVVLRQQKKIRKRPRYFTMVGECFVYGMMEGEALSGKVWKHPYDDAQSFELI